MKRKIAKPTYNESASFNLNEWEALSNCPGSFVTVQWPDGSVMHALFQHVVEHGTLKLGAVGKPGYWLVPRKIFAEHNMGSAPKEGLVFWMKYNATSKSAAVFKGIQDAYDANSYSVCSDRVEFYR